MSWNDQFDSGESMELSDISLTSRVKQRKENTKICKEQQNCNSHVQDELQDKNSPSTNFGSDLQPIPEANLMATKQQNILFGISTKRLSIQSINQSAEEPNFKEKLQELLGELQLLENNQLSMDQKFRSTAQILHEAIRTRSKRNTQMKLYLDTLRKDLNERRQQMKTLIQLLRNTPSSKKTEHNPQPRPLETLKHYQSQKFLQLADRHEQRAPNSEEKNDNKIKILQGRKIVLKEKSDSGRQYKNY